MLKELIKIQIVALLILVMNAVATQDFKLIGSEVQAQPKVKTTKAKVEADAKTLLAPTIISNYSPKEILLDALKKSLN